jgi:uroporphyrinogen-III synthase
MQALITRPEEDAQTLAAPLIARGIVPLFEPLLSIRRLGRAAPDLAGVQALAFTSANGVRAFAAASPERLLPVLAVGDRTAAAARDLGFAAVESAGGDVAALAELVIARLAPSAGAVLHAAGSVVAGDLAGRLASAGFAVRRAVLYEARPARALSPAAQAALREGRVDLALFFSPRTAASFVRLAAAASLGARCPGIDAVCLSPAVAAALKGVAWRHRIVAAAPTQASLLAALDAFLAGDREGLERG